MDLAISLHFDTEWIALPREGDIPFLTAWLTREVQGDAQGGWGGEEEALGEDLVVKPRPLLHLTLQEQLHLLHERSHLRSRVKLCNFACIQSS